jgi:hypothetical protein
VFHDRRLGSRRWNLRDLGCRPGPHFHLLGDGWISPPRCRLCEANRAEERAILEEIRPGNLEHLFDGIPFKRVQVDDGLWARIYEHDVGCGWIVKNLGVRKSTKATARYILSHAAQGILPMPDLRGPEIVTWFGSMAYNNLGVAETVPSPIRCGVCGLEIVAKEWYSLIWVGSGPPPERNEGLAEYGMFIESVPER